MKKEYLPLSLVSCSITLCFGLLFTVFSNTSATEFISPVAEASEVPTLLPIQSISFENDTKELTAKISNILGKETEHFGVVVKNLKTSETIYMNENALFEPASLYKLWILSVAYTSIENGAISEDELLSGDIATLNKQFQLDAEDAELTEGEIQMTVKEALYQMITISHNYAAMLLSKTIRYTNVNAFLEKHELDNSHIGNPLHTTAYDIALFLEKLYTGKLANAKYTSEMIQLLKQQTINHKIPKYLPDSITVAHKTGELGGVSHDAGIIFGTKGDYIVVVLSDTNSPSIAEKKISEISREVYQYFEQ